MRKENNFAKTLATLTLTLFCFPILIGNPPTNALAPKPPVAETTEEKPEPEAQPLNDNVPTPSKKE